MRHAYKTTDLALDERLTVERLLGRPLQNDEAVEIIAHKVDELRSAPEIVDRKLAAARILELAKGKSLGGATVRELIDEGRRF
jgi:hypothetical protein